MSGSSGARRVPPCPRCGGDVRGIDGCGDCGWRPDPVDEGPISPAADEIWENRPARPPIRFPELGAKDEAVSTRQTIPVQRPLSLPSDRRVSLLTAGVVALFVAVLSSTWHDQRTRLAIRADCEKFLQEIDGLKLDPARIRAAAADFLSGCKTDGSSLKSIQLAAIIRERNRARAQDQQAVDHATRRQRHLDVLSWLYAAAERDPNAAQLAAELAETMIIESNSALPTADRVLQILNDCRERLGQDIGPTDSAGPDPEGRRTPTKPRAAST